MNDLSKGQLDLLLTMLVAAAAGTDPFVTEVILKGKGLIDEPSTV